MLSVSAANNTTSSEDAAANVEAVRRSNKNHHHYDENDCSSSSLPSTSSELWTTLEEIVEASSSPQHDMQQSSSNSSSSPSSRGRLNTSSSSSTEPPLFTREGFRHHCCPHGSFNWTLLLPSILSILALTLTAHGSWDCTYFYGAKISFTSDRYGLWTLMDSKGICQRWDVLFFSYRLGGHLKTARFFSMAAIMLGLALTAVLTQALQFHGLSCCIGFAFTLIFIVSAATTSNFNMWAIFFLFTYIIFILIARFMFIHPVHRRISKRGTNIIAAHCFLCCLYTLLTLAVLRSDFCTCKNISADELDGRDPGSPCDGMCMLGAAGFTMMVASFLWFLAGIAVWRFGVQPTELKFDEEKHQHLGFYARHSFVTGLIQKRDAITRQARALAGGVGFGTKKEENLDSGLADAPPITSLYPTTSATSTHSHRLKTVTEDQVIPDGDLEDDDDEDEGNDVGDDNQHESKDPRTCCQKVCFDYRVTRRTRIQKWGFWVFRVMLGILIAIYVFIILVMSFAYQENTQAAKAPDTSYNFITDVVCAFNPLDPMAPFQTFPTKADAANAGFTVAHCGACAYCSNPYDIQTYVETRKTVANSAKKCGPTAVFKPYEELVDCLEDRIGFTRECTECWADNMKTTAKYCLFSCMTTLMTGFATSNNVEAAGHEVWLNQCIFCDEKRSGPEFVTCSGVARRRLGIKSEIERNPKEQCPHVNLNWLDVDFDETFPG